MIFHGEKVLITVSLEFTLFLGLLRYKVDFQNLQLDDFDEQYDIDDY